MRVGYFDLETTSLKGDIGRILCASIKDSRHKKITTFRNDFYLSRDEVAEVRDQCQYGNACLQSRYPILDITPHYTSSL